MPNQIKVRVKGSHKTFLFKNGESLDSIRSILDLHIRNSKLNKEMSFSQQGPTITKAIKHANKYFKDVISGEIALSGLKRLNEIGQRMARGDVDAGIEMLMEFAPIGSISKYIESPHHAWDTEKLESMIKTLREGGNLPPILVHENQAYSGSHRLEAWSREDIDPDYIEIDDEAFKKIMTSMNLDPVYDTVTDFEPFLEESVLLGLAPGAK